MAAISCAQYRRIATDKTRIGKLIKVPPRISYQSLLKENTIGFLTAMINRKLTGEIQFSNVGHEDYVLWLSLLKRGIVAHGLPLDLARYRLSGNSLSSSKFRTARWMWNIYRKIEKLSFLASTWYFIHYALRGYFKHREL
jgi:teichuronic acid biosynthesis glycosyltransferase TuaG